MKRKQIRPNKNSPEAGRDDATAVAGSAEGRRSDKNRACKRFGEDDKRLRVRFYDAQHEKSFYGMCRQFAICMASRYAFLLLYILSAFLSPMSKELDDIIDSRPGGRVYVRGDALEKGWVTGGFARMIRLALHLFTGAAPSALIDKTKWDDYSPENTDSEELWRYLPMELLLGLDNKNRFVALEALRILSFHSEMYLEDIRLSRRGAFEEALWQALNFDVRVIRGEIRVSAKNSGALPWIPAGEIGRIVGATNGSSDRVFLREFWVSEGLRGQGIGRGLIREMCAAARSIGLAQLWVVPDGEYRREVLWELLSRLGFHFEDEGADDCGLRTMLLDIPLT